MGATIVRGPEQGIGHRVLLVLFEDPDGIRLEMNLCLGPVFLRMGTFNPTAGYV